MVELLAERFQVTKAVGAYKVAHGLGPVDTSREGEQERRLTALAAGHGVNPELMSKIFRVIVAEVVANHASVALQVATPSVPSAEHRSAA